MTAASGTAQINGASINYEVRGAGDPLLLMHAGVADSRMWQAQMGPLSQSLRTIRFDMRGFGQSNMPRGEFSNVADVFGLLDYLEVGRVHLCGASFGGLIALDFALSHPERCLSLCLGGPNVSGAAASNRIRALWDDEEAALDRGDLAAATELNLRMWVDGPQRSPAQSPKHVRQRVGQMQRAIFEKDIPDDAEEIGIKPPAIERLKELAMPLLVVVGDLDLPEKLALAEQLVEEAPQAELEIIEGAGHMLSMEAPAQFNQLLLGHIRAAGRNPASG